MKKWYLVPKNSASAYEHTMYSSIGREEKATLATLQKLTDAGVKPAHIKLVSNKNSIFIYYYHSEEVVIE